MVFRVRWNLRGAVEAASKPLARVLGIAVPLKCSRSQATALVGVAIGLTVSGLVQNSAQAVMWMPLSLIPQMLFGGVVLSLPELSRGARAACMVIPSFSCERLMDVSNVYGQALRFGAMRSKLPLFLTPGQRRQSNGACWGGSTTESYDLGTWIAICYGGTLAALAIRQKGK